jgi:transcriptional regulator with XRE-family HTH domain
MAKKRKSKKPPTLREQLLAAIEKSKMSQSELARESGVNQSTISRFLKGKTTVSVDIADKLFQAIGS